jgi:hypothetical protein
VGASPSKRSSKPKAKATNFGEPLLDSARIHAAAGAGASRQQGQGGQPQVLNPFSVLDGNREPIRQHSMFMNADKAQQAAGGAGGASAPAATGASSQAGLTFSSQTAGGFSFPASQLQQQQQAGAGGTGFVWPQPHATQQPPAPTAPAMAFGGAAIMANAGSQAPPAGTSGVSFSMGQKDNAPTPSRSHRRSKPAPTQAAAAPEVARAASFQGFGSDAGGPAGGASTPVFGRYAAAGAGATAAGPDQQQANRSPSVAPMSTQQAGPAAQQQQQQPVFGGVGDFAPMSVQQPAAPAATPLTAQFSAMSIDPVTLEPQAGVAAASGTPATAQQEMPVRKLFQTPSPFGGFKTAAAELSPQEQGGPPSPFGMFGATAVPSFSLGEQTLLYGLTTCLTAQSCMHGCGGRVSHTLISRFSLHAATRMTSQLMTPAFQKSIVFSCTISSPEARERRPCSCCICRCKRRGHPHPFWCPRRSSWPQAPGRPHPRCSC